MSEFISQSAQREIQSFVSSICRGIYSAKKRRKTEQEFTEHVQDHVYRLLLQGKSEEQAVLQALNALGDPEILCHQLCAVHNRISPEFGKKLLLLVLRSIVAIFIHGILWGVGLTQSAPVSNIVPLFIVLGWAPIRYVRSLILRIKQVILLKRICQRKGFAIQCLTSPILSVLIPARYPEWQIETTSKIYCIHFLAVHNRHATLRLLDSFAYILATTHGQGARFIDRAPRRFNLLKTGDQTYERQSFHALHFPISADMAERNVERILLLNPVPSVIQYRKGTTFEYAGNADYIFNFTLYDGRSFATLLLKL